MKTLLYTLIFVFSITGLCAQELGLMSYNIRLATESDGENAWSERKEFLKNQVLFYAPDVMGIQEALPEQMQYLNDNLKDYKSLGVGREGENKGEFSALFYNAAKLDVLKSDKLGKIDLSIRGCLSRDKVVLRFCKSNLLPVAVSMGGSYSEDIKQILEAHYNTFRIAKEVFF